MIYIDDNTKEKIKNMKAESIYYIMNFDNVITDIKSCNTWEMIFNKIKLNKTQIKRWELILSRIRNTDSGNNSIYNEESETLNNLWLEKIDIFNQLNIDTKRIKNIISKTENFNIRKGLKDFLKHAFQHDIPVIIISEGIYEVIETFLNYHNCLYDNIYIFANRLEMKDKQNVIHSMNRNMNILSKEVKEKIENRLTTILLASSVNDIEILSKENLRNSIKIVFLDEFINDNFDVLLNYFNIILTHNTSMDIIKDLK